MNMANNDDFLLNHVFLPIKLPQENDGDSGATALLQILHRSVKEYALTQTGDAGVVWGHLAVSTSLWLEVHDNGSLCENTVMNALLSLQINGKSCIWTICETWLTSL